MDPQGQETYTKPKLKQNQTNVEICARNEVGSGRNAIIIASKISIAWLIFSNMNFDLKFTKNQS